jgi:adenosylhomocysteinase
MATNAEAAPSADAHSAEAGKRRIEWAFHSMPVLQSVRKQFIKTQPLAGIRIAACLHITTETANLMITLRDGGAIPVLCASRASTIQDEVASSLELDYSIPTKGRRGASPDAIAENFTETLLSRPQITIDDGANLVQALHTKVPELASEVIGGTEETKTGILRLKALAKEGHLRYPIIAINDAMTKHLFDDRYGTGQSTMDGILRATNMLLAGSTLVVAGYGWCGRGVAMRARGMGANVVVCEVDPVKALEALMDGYRVMSMGEAAAIGDVFVTVTGNKSVIHREHFGRMKNGAILCNSGHFNVEIDVEGLTRLASGKKPTREFVDEYTMRDGRRLYVLGEGGLINLASAEGHPASVMDLSFANLALSVEYLIRNHSSLEKKVYAVPEELDRHVARLKLEAMGVKIDRLSIEQEQYLASWGEAN